MSEQSECRNTISRRAGYTAIPNAVFSDGRLSMEARGFLGLLMSMREGWVFKKTNLMKTSGFGRDKYYRVLNELIGAGYLKITQGQSEGGHFTENVWEITDQPEAQDVEPPCPENPDTVTASLKPVSGSAVSGKPAPLRNNNSKKNNPKPPKPPRGQGKGFSESGFGASQRSLERILEKQRSGK